MARRSTKLGCFALVLVFSVTVSLSAQKSKKKYKGIRWVPSYKAALAEGRDRGCPVMVVITNKSAHDNTTKITLADKGVITNAKRFVCVVAHNDYSHTPKTKKGKRLNDSICPIYGTIKCSDHVKAWASINARFVRQSVVQTIDVPQHIYVDPINDEELFRRLGPLGRKEMQYDMMRAQKLVGKGLSYKACKPVRENLEEAGKLIQRGQYRRAAELLDKYQGFKKKHSKTRSALFKDGDEMIVELENKGNLLIREARDLESEGNLDKAKHLLERVYREFKPFEISDKARSELNALRRKAARKK